MRLLTNVSLALAVALAMVVGSCRNVGGNPEWDVDIIAPIATADLGIEDFANVKYLTTDSFGAYHFTFQDTVFSLELDTLFDLPDTTIEDEFFLPFGTLTFAPGQSLIHDTFRTKYDLQDAELTEVILKEGFATVELSSSIDEAAIFTYALPLATLSGQPLVVSDTVPANGSVTATYNLAGYRFDLTGFEGNRINTMTTIIDAVISPTGQNVVINAGDQLEVTNTLSNIVPSYGHGYFGSQTTTFSGSETSNIFANIKGGTLELEALDATLSVVNYAGADLSLNVQNVSVANTRLSSAVVLDAPFLGLPQHVNRATEEPVGSLPSTPAIFELEQSSSNSNIHDALAALPETYHYNVDLQINPLGNISGTHDFLFTSHGLDLLLQATAPVRFSSNELQLVDTVEIDFEQPQNQAEIDNINSGTIYINALNGFPAGVQLQLVLMDANHNRLSEIMGTANTLAAAMPLPDGGLQPTESQLQFPVDQQRISDLFEAAYVEIQATLTTPQPGTNWHFYASQRLKLSVTTDFNYRLQP